MMAKDGYRSWPGASDFTGDAYPKKQQDFQFHFMGLLAFYDPPKPNIRSVFEKFYRAGIQVKIISGDNAITTTAIARQAGFKNPDASIQSDALTELSERELEERVKKITIYTRMFPEAKLRIINALKKNGDIVAMTGDGVNDAPALKASHIGIAMGKRGSALARSAASLILTDDDFSKMTDAIAMGRRIYSNLKKAIQYIISIHIPIILTVFLPLILGWAYPNIFTPVHVIFLELIMGPTCSIIYENEP
jgi:Ca2+-transporting ATPase